MRTLAPLLAFAFSCTGASASSQSPPPPRPSPPAAQPPQSQATAAPPTDAGPSPQAKAQETLDAPGSPAPLVRSALAVLAKTEGAEAIPTIAAKLSSRDVTVRRAAAEALGEIGGPKARAALQKQLDAEDQPEVRAAIERAMAKASP